MNGRTRTIVGLQTVAGRAMGGRGFTLVEVIISIGAVAIVSVGLAAIFQTIGATVSQGQKVSALTQTAAVLEQQMRRDITAMTREGFLVIRNQFAGPRTGGQFWNVGINKDDASPRERRVDEILFFSKGDYETARAPINPAVVARGDTAMVYYGHVLRPLHRQDANGRFTQSDVRPSVSSINDPDPARPNDNVPGRDDLYAYGGGGSFGESFAGRALPNTYAENWMLGRKVTILASPKSAREDFPSRGWPSPFRLAAGGGAPTGRLSENEVQIASQPAASQVFRSLARQLSIVRPGEPARRDRITRPVTGTGGDPGAAFPQLSSGLVDIATTDLNEIRTIVQTFQADPWDGNLLAKYNSVSYADPAAAPNADFDTTFRAGAVVTPDLDRMHAWMRDAFPTQSDRFGRSDPTDPRGARVRAEVSPPDYLNVISDFQGNAGEDSVALLTRRADQAMLTQGVIAARCTEFIVEWSFGEEIVSATLDSQVRWYGTTEAGQQFSQYDENNGRHNPLTGRSGLSESVVGHFVRTRLIYGSTVPPRTQTQTAHFGYYDPYFAPRVDARGNIEAGSPAVMPWAWPKLIRVTVALVDERDPLKEERFQWVFEMPGTPDPQ